MEITKINAKPLPGDDQEPWALAIIPGIGLVEIDPELAKELLANED